VLERVAQVDGERVEVVGEAGRSRGVVASLERCKFASA
jgi:hypothetical protein